MTARRGFYRHAARLVAVVALGTAACVVSPAQPPAPGDLTRMNLEDLMNLQVTSVSKKEQRLSKAGAAVYVVTEEDIRRSGATSIPDLLRMVPGVHVARMDNHTWAISVRGFTDRYGDKVLVLIDGRSVYTPLTSGVNWDQQDVPLEDIERIEVIRGPGGTVWGANAVNGVINILTKSAKVTQGGLVSAGAGSQKASHGLVQQGGQLGPKGAYRVFGDYSNLGDSPPANGGELADGWHKSHAGFRSDWDLSPKDTATVQGDLFQSREGQTIDTLFSNDLPREAVINDKISVGAGNVLGRWNHSFASGSATGLQIYYDRSHRVDQVLAETRNTIDLDFQHHLTLGSRQEIVWGLGYRVTADNVTPGYAKEYNPARRTDSLFSAFIQDEFRLTNTLWLSLGSKFEHNAYTGFEYQPSAQVVWNLTDRQTVWVSAARAIRQPSRSDFHLAVDLAAFPLDNGGLGIVQLTGNPNRKAERAHDFEVGYRAQVRKQFSVDIATFTTNYQGLQTTEPGQPFYESSNRGVPAQSTPPNLVMPLLFDDRAHAHNYGAEVFANWNLTSRWRISPGYTYLQMHVAGDSSSQDANAGAIASESPKHQFQIRSFVNLTRRLDWDTSVFRVGGLADGGSGATPGYTRLDTHLGFRAAESLELSITGQNLLGPVHAEYHDSYGVFHGLVKRSAFAGISFRF